MSFWRKWFDPYRSRRYLQQKPATGMDGASYHLQLSLRLDDVYSYFLIQLLDQLVPVLDPQKIRLTITLHTREPDNYPGFLTARQWQQYSLRDAQMLATHYGFTFDCISAPPSVQSVPEVLPLLAEASQSQDFIVILQNIAHVLWQQQHRKLQLLQTLIMNGAFASSLPSGLTFRVDQQLPLVSATFILGDHTYRGLDDLLRLGRHLTHIGAVIQPPIFLTNHTDWGERQLHNPGLLAKIQAARPVLHVFGAMEDPFIWIILHYLQRFIVDYYNIRLVFQPLPYQHRDRFDWGRAARLSRRTRTPFIPFCRPTASDTLLLASFLLGLPADRQTAALLFVLEQVWAQGRTVTSSMAAWEKDNASATRLKVSEPAVHRWLKDNQQQLDALGMPYLPAFSLEIGEERYPFCSIYRLWQIESLLVQHIEKEPVHEN